MSYYRQNGGGPRLESWNKIRTEGFLGYVDAIWIFERRFHIIVALLAITIIIVCLIFCKPREVTVERDISEQESQNTEPYVGSNRMLRRVLQARKATIV